MQDRFRIAENTCKYAKLRIDRQSTEREKQVGMERMTRAVVDLVKTAAVISVSHLFTPPAAGQRKKLRLVALEGGKMNCGWKKALSQQKKISSVMDEKYTSFFEWNPAKYHSTKAIPQNRSSSGVFCAMASGKDMQDFRYLRDMKVMETRCCAFIESKATRCITH